MDSPEEVLLQAHGQARTIMDFLHENGSFPFVLSMLPAYLKIHFHVKFPYLAVILLSFQFWCHL